MNKLIISLCMFSVSCSAADKAKITIVSCYSSMTSKERKHEVVLSDGTCITLKSSQADIGDVKVTISQRKPFDPKKK